jgi:regulator of RNase E activity RraA
MIGEILGGHLRRRGCGGLVCDGAVRDVATLAAWPDFSVYARFITPRGPTSAEHGAINIPVVIGGTLVSPGDIVIGDDDGLVALAPATARMRLPDANAKIAKEAMWIRSLEGGQSAKATFGLDVA